MLKDHRNMNVKLSITSLSAVLSDPSRLAIVRALLDGRSLTANELAHGAGITPQTASFHLRKLIKTGLVEVTPNGRHRFFKLTSSNIADALATLLEIAPDSSSKPAAKRHNNVCFARTCYGHLAGYLGIALAEAAENKGYVKREGDHGYIVTRSGEHFLAKLDIDISDLRRSRRQFASQCLDWSERKPHIGGALGFALTTEYKNRDWIQWRKGHREVSITTIGKKALLSHLGVDVDQLYMSFFESE